MGSVGVRVGYTLFLTLDDGMFENKHDMSEQLSRKSTKKAQSSKEYKVHMGDNVDIVSFWLERLVFRVVVLVYVLRFV